MPDQLTIHVKVLTAPTRFQVNEMVDAVISVYGSVGIDVQLGSTEVLNVRDDRLAFLNTVQTGACLMSGTPAEEIVALSAFRDMAAEDEIVIYICRSVRSVDGPLKGCGGVWPKKKPMAVISKSAPLYTMAHEIGHVIGLRHAGNDDTRLMTSNGAEVFNRPPAPEFSRREIEAIRSSDLIT